MNEATLPPSPNWYLSTILTCSFNGTVAWGARCDIIIAKPSDIDNTLQYSIIKHAFKLKVTSLAFTPQFEEVNSNLLASTGTENIINVWDAETLSVVHSHLIEKDTHPVAVSWSCKDPHVLYSVTSVGHVLCWNVYFNIVSSIVLGKATPTCISSCPHDPHLVAVGAKSGLIYIISFQGKGNIVHKCGGHDAEVVSLSWCPSENNVIHGNMNKDLLLASGAKDRSIFIWKAGGDGRCDIKISVPRGPLYSQQHKSKRDTLTNNWIVVDWLEPKLLLACSTWGELISWDLPTMTKGKPVWKLVHSYYSVGLLCIAHALNLQNNLSTNWRLKQRHQIWTVTLDRRVICYGIQGSNVEIDYNICTQGSYVYCIVACPFDTSNLALGVGGGTLSLWNLSEPHKTTFNITTLWQKSNEKIRAIAWHPEKENLLAYATEQGQIAVFNTNSKQPISFKQYYKSTVYTIGWGPNAENRYVLYSCGDGELAYYDLEKPNEDPTSVLKNECVGFAWNEDFSCLAVGFDNGSISFLNKKFETRGYAKITSKMIYCLVWHPESTATDTAFSPLKYYFAVSSKKSAIYILDLSNFMNHFTKLETSTSNEDSNEKVDVYNVHEVVATLNGHRTSVVCLAWSPYISSHLVSGDYNATVQVWNVERQELIATYTKHKGPVLCCLWSPLDPNYIITGAADHTVRIWKMTDYSPQNNIDTNVVKKSNEKQHTKANNTVNISIKSSASDLTDTMPECTASNNLQVVPESKEVLIKNTKQKKPARKSCSIKRNMTDETFLLKSLLSVVKNIKGINTEENQDHVNNMPAVLFSTKENLMSFISSEKSRHMENNAYDHAIEMDIWSGNLKQNLEEAAKEQRLNDFLVSLSASLSVKIWREMCERYAYQLQSQGNFCKAASYFLCIHKIHKALEVYESADLYEEAYILARCQLEPDDPILTKILHDWAIYTVRTGNYVQAAYIYVVLSEFDNAVKYLSRCKRVKALTTAAEMALLCSDENMSKHLSEQAIFVAFKNSEYDTARDIIEKFPHLKCQTLYLLTLEELENIMEKNISFNTIDMWLNGQSNYGLLQVIEELAYTNCNNTCTELHQTSIPDDEKNERMLWLTAGCELALTAVCTDKEQKLKHIAIALHTIDQYETTHRNELRNQSSFLTEIVIKLDIKNLRDKESIYAKTEYPISMSLRAYLCNALLNWFVCNVHHESVSDNIGTYITLIENLLEDAVNKQTVKYWTIATDISKLESQIISSMHKTTSGKDTNNKDTELLVEQLNALKAQWKQCLNELVHVPNPVMIYTKANELCSKLLDESIQSQFSEIIIKAWSNAII